MYEFWERLITFLSLWLGWSAQTQFNPKGIVSSEVNEWVAGIRDRWGVQGMSVVVVTSPEYAHGDGKWNHEVLSYGTADGVKDVSENTVWTLPSASKFVTSLALAHLIDSNVTLENGELLTWDTPISSIYPEWDASLPEEVETYGLEMDACHVTISELGRENYTEHARDAPFRFVSVIIEQLSGMPYHEYAAKHVLSHIKLESMEQNDAMRASGFIREGVDSCLGKPSNIGWWTDRYVPPWNEEDDLFYLGTVGESLSSRQMADYLKAFIDKSNDLPRLVSLDPGYKEALLNLRAPEEEGRRSMSTGFGRYYHLPPPGKLIASHHGTMGAQSSMMLWAPEDGFGIMVAVNDDYYGEDLAYMISSQIMEDLLHSQHVDREAGYISRLSFAGETIYRQPTQPRHPAPPSTNVYDSFRNMELGQLLFKRNVERSPGEEMEYQYIRREFDSNKGKGTRWISTHGPMYVSEVRNKFIFDKLVLTHWDGDHYNWTGVNLWNFPNRKPEGAKWTPDTEDQHRVVEIVGSGAAEVIEAGIKLRGIWWNPCGERIIYHDDYVEGKGQDSFADRVIPGGDDMSGLVH